MIAASIICYFLSKTIDIPQIWIIFIRWRLYHRHTNMNGINMCINTWSVIHIATSQTFISPFFFDTKRYLKRLHKIHWYYYLTFIDFTMLTYCRRNLYRANTGSPMFYQSFEFDTHLPGESGLTVTIMHHDGIFSGLIIFCFVQCVFDRTVYKEVVSAFFLLPLIVKKQQQ